MSAYTESAKVVSLPAGSDLSANQYHLVSVNGSGQLALTGAGAKADGVLYDDPAAAGRAGKVAIHGIVKVKAGAVVAAGANVTSDATGRAVAATTGNVICGKALQAAGAADEIIAVLFHPTETSA